MLKGKKVLAIGCPDQAREALQQGAELVESISFDPDEDTLSHLATWEGRRGLPGKVLVRNVHAASLKDQGEWDTVLVNGVAAPEGELDAFLDSVRAALTPNGTLACLSTKQHGIIQRAAPDDMTPAPPAGKPAPHNNVILHVHNVRRCGGTGNFVYDMATCFPEFQHTALCVNDPAGDDHWIRDVSGTMRTMYAPLLTKEILEEINPKVLVLHATVGKRLEGEWPYNWLGDGGRRYVVAVHHISTFPLLPADLDVFVSEFVKKKYEPFFDRMREHALIPPCTNAELFATVDPNRDFRGLRFTTGGKHCQDLDEVLRQASGWIKHSAPPGRVGRFHTYLAQFPYAVVWSGLPETWCRTVTEAMAAGCVTIAHRAGAIPEQIEHGVNGYLFDSPLDLLELLKSIQDLANDDPQQLARLANKGRAWAVKHAGFQAMRSYYYPYLMKAMIDAP